MDHSNAGRVILGGTAGAVIVFIVAGLLPGITLDAGLKVWHQSTESLYTHPSRSVEMLFFAVMSLVFGLTGTWIYAGIRPGTVADQRPLCWQAFSRGYQVGLRQRWGTWPWETTPKRNWSLFRAFGDSSEPFSLPSRGQLSIRSSPLAFRKSLRNAGSNPRSRGTRRDAHCDKARYGRQCGRSPPKTGSNNRNQG
jgi:hypothetical protein